MYWYKIKSVLIVLFALINVFLVGALCYGTIQDAITINEMNGATKEVLKTNDISFEGEIPKKRGEVPSVSLRAAFEEEKAFARAWLGGEADTVYTGEGKAIYKKGSKTILMFGSYFEFDNGGKEKQALSKEDIKSAARMAKEAGLDLGQMSAEIQKNKIVYSFMIDKKYKVHADVEITLCEDGQIKTAKGYALTAEKSGGKIKIRPAAGALVEFVQNHQKSGGGKAGIKKVELGYSLFLGDTSISFKSAEAIPAWVITLDDGQYLYYDARNN